MRKAKPLLSQSYPYCADHHYHPGIGRRRWGVL